MNTNELNLALKTKLESSLLHHKKHRNKLQFEALPPSKFPSSLPQKHLGQSAAAPGFIIPYFELDGTKTDYFRFRYLAPPKLKGFAAHAAHKQPRYLQPANTEPRAYFPPLVAWETIASLPSVPVVITEGELKAAATTAYTSFPTVGLGGVWSWRSAKKNYPLIPDLLQIEWKDRRVYIAFDSDAMTNPQVVRAECALVTQLISKGAVPHIVRLPPGPDGEKQGLDDFLLRHSSDELEELINSAEPCAESLALHELNARVAYIRETGTVVEYNGNIKMRPAAFTDHAFLPLRFYRKVVAPDGSEKLKEFRTAKEWLKWPGRTELDRYTYAPGKPRIFARQYNTWAGWGADPVPGDVSLWNELLDALFGADKESRTWFERWLAYPLQHPGTKLYTAPVLWSREHGTGKSFIGYAMKQIYGANWGEINEAALRQGHNGWVENKQFIMADELASSDKRTTADALKSVITRETISINQKYIPEYTIPDTVNWYFTSNHPDALFLEDDDRRYFVYEVTGQKKSPKFWSQFEHWIRRDIYEDASGPSALFAHLLQIDLADFNPRAAAPETQAKHEMRTLGRSDLGAWVETLRTSPNDVLRIGDHVLSHSLFTAEELRALYDPDSRTRVSNIGMARELKRQGFVKAAGGAQCPTDDNRQLSLWVCRPIVDSAVLRSPSAAGKAYSAQRKSSHTKLTG